MTKLEQYQKAYAILVGQVDKAITNLETGKKAFQQEENELALAGGTFMDALIGMLTGALYAAEEIFLDEDPEE